MNTATHCRDCEAQLFSQARWRALGAEGRRVQREAGFRPHIARGLCQTCYSRAVERGALIDRERFTVPTAEVAAEWSNADLPRDWSKAKRIRHLAPRMGVSEAALEKALLRAGVAA